MGGVKRSSKACLQPADPTPRPPDPATSKGKLNIYVCQSCRGHIVTRDVDDGVTPMFIQCRAPRNCDGQMQSSMYRVFDQSMREDHQWYRPSAVEVLPEHWRSHVEMGGLLIRKAA